MATVFDANHFRSRAAASDGNGGSGGGCVDETQKRLTAIETTQARTQVILEGLATKIELEKVNTALEKIIGRLLALETLMPHMATKADLNRVEGELKSEINSVRVEIAKSHASTVKWLIGTLLTGMTAAFTIARYFAGS